MIPTLNTARRIAIPIITFSLIVTASAPVTSNIPITPGPTVMGIVRGTMAIFRLLFWLLVSLFSDIMEIAERKRIVPAPMRNASRVMPKSSKIYLPKRKKIKELIRTPTVTLTAVCFFSVSSKSLVNEIKAERTKNGVRIKKIFK